MKLMRAVPEINVKRQIKNNTLNCPINRDDKSYSDFREIVL